MGGLESFAPMLLSVAGAVVGMLLDAWERRSASVLVSVAGVALGAAVAAWLANGDATYELVARGGASSLLAAACLALTAVAVAASYRTLARAPEGPRIAALAAFAASAAALLACSRDLGVTFLAVEALSLCGFGLVAAGDTDRAREAAMKWFVQSSLATALMVVAIGLLISRTGGALGYAAIQTAASSGAAPESLVAALGLVMVALLFKAGAFPFHSWMPDVLETAPPAASAVLASAGKIGPISAAVWLAVAAGPVASRTVGAFVLVSAGSIVFGNLAALRQRSLSRMLGYSAIAQIGYALAAAPVVTGREAALIFVVIYALSSAGSFVFVVAMRELEPSWDGSIAGLAGLGRRHPTLSASLTVVMLSLTGIPLTAGFWGKFVVFGIAATQGYLWLAVVAVLGSVVSFGYYGSVLRSVFLDEAPPETGVAGQTGRRELSVAEIGTLGIALAILVGGMLPLFTGLGPFGLLG